MAYPSNRTRFPSQNYGYGFNRSDYQASSVNRNNHPMMRNCNGNIPMQMHRFPGGGPSHNMAGPYAGRPPPFPGTNDPMMRPPPFRGRSMMNGNRMPTSNIGFPQGFPDPGFYRDGPPRMRFPNGGGNNNERFFVPWNQRPKQFYAAQRLPVRNQPRPPTFNQSKSQPKDEDKPKRKRNKKRKYSARPKEDSKKLKPWMTDEIYEEVRKKNEMYVKCKNEDKPELWQEFRLLRNRVSSLIKDAKLKGGFITRKQKDEDSTERPFSCDTCDRAFVDETELENHVKDHVKCDIDGCPFDAHPKVVELHKKMQHETGYASTIMKLKTDEEIQKWREERKNHYPTVENIKKRQAETQEKADRGEVVAPKEFGKFRRRGTDRRNQNARSFRHQRNSWRGTRAQERRAEAKLRWLQDRQAAPPTKREKIGTDDESDSEEETHIGLHPFLGMVDSLSTQAAEPLLSDTLKVSPCPSPEKSATGSETPPNSITFDPTDQLCTHAENVAEHSLNDSALNSSFSELVPVVLPSGSLESFECAMEIEAGTADDVVAEENEEDTFVTRTDSLMQVQELDTGLAVQESNLVIDSDDEAPDLIKISKEPVDMLSGEKDILPDTEKTETSANSDMKRAPYNYHKKQRERCDKVKSHPNGVKTSCILKNSLLEKLLAREIAHERNIILQCIRYTVRNNFFRY